MIRVVQLIVAGGDDQHGAATAHRLRRRADPAGVDDAAGAGRLPVQALRTIPRVEDGVDELAVGGIEVRRDLVKPKPGLLGRRWVVGAGGDGGVMSSLLELPGQPHHGMQIPETSQRRQGDVFFQERREDEDRRRQAGSALMCGRSVDGLALQFVEGSGEGGGIMT